MYFDMYLLDKIAYKEGNKGIIDEHRKSPAGYVASIDLEGGDPGWLYD